MTNSIVDYLWPKGRTGLWDALERARRWAASLQPAGIRFGLPAGITAGLGLGLQRERVRRRRVAVRR